MQMIDKLLENGVTSAQSIVSALPNAGIPLGGVVTFATLAVSLYTGGRRARDVAEKISQGKANG